MDSGFVSFRKLISISLLFILPIAEAYAESLSVDLGNISYFDKSLSTGFWNAVDRRVQAPVARGGAPANIVDFGDGSDGAFSNGPTQTGITVSGTSISINTSVKSTFQFSTFNLSAGYTITVTGNSPLTIRVSGTAAIAGTIRANGNPGTGNNGLPGSQGDGTTNTNGLGAIAGGAGVSGGGNGGNGASSTGAPAPVAGATAGIAASTRGGTAGANSSGGTNTPTPGTGGCVGTGGDAGNNASPACGATNNRATVAGLFESSFVGGAGGAGGGAGDDLGAILRVSGGGGGGGGGAVHFISASSIALTGTLESKGGEGGNYHWETAVPVCGSGGGGGSGGEIWIQTLHTITGSTTIDVSRGAGGISSGASCAAAFDGGVGSRGVFRYDADSVPIGGFPNALLPAAATADNFQITPVSSGTYDIVSKPISFGFGYWILDSVTTTSDTSSSGCGTNGTLSLLFEGSNDGVNFSAGVAPASFSQLANYLYIRFKATISVTSSGSPCMTGLSINYSQKSISDLNLKGGLFCGSINSSPNKKSEDKNNSPTSPLAIIGDLFFLIIAAGFCTRFRNKKQYS